MIASVAVYALHQGPLVPFLPQSQARMNRIYLTEPASIFPDVAPVHSRSALDLAMPIVTKLPETNLLLADENLAPAQYTGSPLPYLLAVFLSLPVVVVAVSSFVNFIGSGGDATPEQAELSKASGKGATQSNQAPIPYLQ